MSNKTDDSKIETAKASAVWDKEHGLRSSVPHKSPIELLLPSQQLKENDAYRSAYRRAKEK